jgi:putative peptide zinc metalloprotease protein
MPAAQPQLRRDLLLSCQETPDGSFLVIKDPATRRFFRFGEAEHFIIQQLDGSTALDVIQQRVETMFGVVAPLDTLAQFIASLRRIGLLQEDGAQGGLRAGPLRRVRGSLLYLRLKAFDPDRLLERLINKLNFFFTPYFLGISAALILIALGITLLNWGEIGRGLLHLYRFEILLLAWLTVFAVTTAHEFAHGLTCKRFGGEVHEIGFLLLFFQPAFYCDVSDAWLFPEKGKRLWVTFSGAYFEIFLWALATLTWRITEPATMLHFLALAVMATSGIKTLFNLNPLIKLDGYYLLSDALEIPNLRQRSFRYLRTATQKLWGAASQGINEVTPRERRIYLVYGLFAAAYSFWLLSFVVLHFGGFLIGRYQGLGLLILTGLLMVVFRNPLTKVLPKPMILFWTERRSLASLKQAAKILMVLGTVLAVLFLGRMELRVSGEFKILPVQNADVRAAIAGIIQEVDVDEGDLVSAGDVLARLYDRDYRAELQKIEAEIDEKRAKLKMLKLGPRREEIDRAQKEVETAKTRQDHAWKRYHEAKQLQAARLTTVKVAIEKAAERLKYARDYLGMLNTLKELISRKEMAEAEERVAVRGKELEEAQSELKTALADTLAGVRQAVAVAEKELAEAEARLTLLLAGSRPEEIEAIEAELARIEAQRVYLREQLELVRVVSPISGVITTPKLKEKLGQHMNKGDLIAQVHQLHSVTAEIPISEKEIADVRVGERLVLKARAYPEHSFYGQVTAIAPTATKDDNGSGVHTILVTTTIDNAAFLLKPEMTGNAKVLCGRRRIVDLMTRRFARYIRVEFWSWW